MRAPLQVLIIPFRHSATGIEYAVTRRSDTGTWQWISGGAEDDETALEAAARELREETGIDAPLLRLDTVSSIPAHYFAASERWGPEVHVVPEYSFGVDTGSAEITLCAEHSELRWLTYEEAIDLLKWDSNRTALWELRRRLDPTATQRHSATATRDTAT